MLDLILTTMSATTTTTASTNNKGGGKIDFDEVLKQIGPLGIYQYFQLFLLFLVTLSAGICVTVFVFTGFVPNYRCVVPQCESLNNATYYGNHLLVTLFKKRGLSSTFCSGKMLQNLPYL